MTGGRTTDLAIRPIGSSANGVMSPQDALNVRVAVAHQCGLDKQMPPTGSHLILLVRLVAKVQFSSDDVFNMITRNSKKKKKGCWVVSV